ncbi:MAG: hypothetical protein ACYDCN_14790 [Bacteroidia bacterium]
MDRMFFWIEKAAVGGGFVLGGEMGIKRYEFQNNPGHLWDNSAMTTMEIGVTMDYGVAAGMDEGFGSLKIGPWENPFIPLQGSNNVDYGAAFGPFRIGGSSDWAQNESSKSYNDITYNTGGLGIGLEIKSPLKNIAVSLGFPNIITKTISSPKPRTMKDSIRTALANPSDSTTKAFLKRHPEYKK